MSFEKFFTACIQITSVVEKKIDFIINYLFSLSCDSGEINHLHLIKCETVRPIKDCFRVLYSTWYEAVAVIKVCIWTNVTVGIIADVDVVSSTKCWTITSVPKNCVFWTFHHALEWCQSFFVDEGKYKSVRRVAVCVTRIWIQRKTISKGIETNLYDRNGSIDILRC